MDDEPLLRGFPFDSIDLACGSLQFAETDQEVFAIPELQPLNTNKDLSSELHIPELGAANGYLD